MQKSLRQNKGFTLIEVLVAIVLLTLGMLGVASLTIGVIKGNAYSKNVSTATVIAQQQIDQAQRVGYASLGDLAGTSTVAMGDKNFTRMTTVTDNSPATNMKALVVSVAWSPGNYSVTLNTTISE